MMTKFIISLVFAIFFIWILFEVYPALGLILTICLLVGIILVIIRARQKNIADQYAEKFKNSEFNMEETRKIILSSIEQCGEIISNFPSSITFKIKSTLFTGPMKFRINITPSENGCSLYVIYLSGIGGDPSYALNTFFQNYESNYNRMKKRRISNEQRIAEEQRKANEQRIAEEQRKANEQRIAEERRIAEEQRAELINLIHKHLNNNFLYFIQEIHSRVYYHNETRSKGVIEIQTRNIIEQAFKDYKEYGLIEVDDRSLHFYIINEIAENDFIMQHVKSYIRAKCFFWELYDEIISDEDISCFMEKAFSKKDEIDDFHSTILRIISSKIKSSDTIIPRINKLATGNHYEYGNGFDIISSVLSYLPDAFLDEYKKSESQKEIISGDYFNMIFSSFSDGKLDEQITSNHFISVFYPDGIDRISKFLVLKKCQQIQSVDSIIQNIISIPQLAENIKSKIEEYQIMNDTKHVNIHVNSENSDDNISIDDMNAYDFEEYVAHVLSNLGYKSQTTQKSGDYGVDIVAEKDDVVFAIQVKHYSGSVGVDAIKEVVTGKQFYNADKCMVITNSTFTKQAKELATANRVTLWDGNKLKEKINQ